MSVLLACEWYVSPALSNTINMHRQLERASAIYQDSKTPIAYKDRRHETRGTQHAQAACTRLTSIYVLLVMTIGARL